MINSGLGMVLGLEDDSDQYEKFKLSLLLLMMLLLKLASFAFYRQETQQPMDQAVLADTVVRLFFKTIKKYILFNSITITIHLKRFVH
jgi:hypothetical protein